MNFLELLAELVLFWRQIALRIDDHSVDRVDRIDRVVLVVHGVRRLLVVHGIHLRHKSLGGLGGYHS